MVLVIGLNITLIKLFGAFRSDLATFIAGLISLSTCLVVKQHFYKKAYGWKKIIWVTGIFFFGSKIIITLDLNIDSYIIY